MSFFVGASVNFSFTLTQEGTAVDLTGTTITVDIKADGNATPLIQDGVVTIDDGAGGLCSFTMASPFAEADTHQLQLKIDFGGTPTQIRYTNLISFTVAALLAP